MLTVDNREAQRVRNQRHYAKVRSDPEAWAKECARAQAYCDSKLRFLKAVKETIGCIDCGTNERRLDFDHRPGTVKEFTLGKPRVSWARLLIELEKCDVRCVSCHARRHNIGRSRHCKEGCTCRRHIWRKERREAAALVSDRRNP